MWQHWLGLHKTKVYMDNVSVEYVGTYVQVSAETIAVTQYIGAYEDEFDSYNNSWQYGVERTKWTGRVPNNEYHMNSWC